MEGEETRSNKMDPDPRVTQEKMEKWGAEWVE